MKIKKIAEMFSGAEWVRIWGDSEEAPIWEGYAEDIPYRLANRELIKGPDDIYIDIRYGGNTRFKDHIAVFVEGE